VALLWEVPLVGAGGEPISFARTVHSHGCAQLPPAEVLEDPLRYRRRLRIGERVVGLTMYARDGKLVVETDRKLGKRDAERARQLVAKMFRLHDDLSPLYARLSGDADLGWAVAGAGRILASPTVFEDVIKTICTTNCAWSATIRMTSALVELGGGAFPDPALLARTPLKWYAGVAKMGYRGPYVRAIAADVAAGRLDLESLVLRERYDDAAVEEFLLALPGVGPYAAAHVMQLLGRHRPLILDSWTRPTYLRRSGRKRAADATIRRAFARYGEYAGLAFWLFLTEDWVAD
jgi:N-glycosylase/DNA lyase